MNFFKHQDDARRKSTQLTVLLIAAVCAVITISTLFISVFIYFFNSSYVATGQIQQLPLSEHLINTLQADYFIWVSLGVVSVVVLGSLLKRMQLRAGGSYVAQSLGGRPLTHDNANTKEKQLLNIVEEMALASGTSVPQVYLLEESGINAFAAGLNPNNAVIGMTQGCVDTLNRDQLQGVIAHEFSHIYHGDMRLNIRLIGFLSGIMVLAQIGYLILRSRSSSRKSDKHHQ